MRLSKRLHMIAELIDAGLIVADIGTDHGYIPIYQVENGLSPYAYACDVNEGPLLRAKDNISISGQTEKIGLLLSDGLDALNELKENKPEAIVIAGMGGLLMIRILSRGAEALKSVKELILSPHSEQEEVRRFLYDTGFSIVQEKMTKEDGKFYVAIKAVPSGNENKNNLPLGQADLVEYVSDTDFRYGASLLKYRDAVLYEHLLKEKDTLCKIADNLEKNGRTGSEEKLRVVNEKLESIQSVLGGYYG